MARSVDTDSARNIVKAFKAFIADTDSVCNYDMAARGQIASLAEGAVSYDAAEALRQIPVEELNRDKKGIRVKTLRDNGYATIADIERAPLSALSKISGISPEAASVIKRAASKIAELSALSVHLRLSADNKTPAATKLVCELSRYISLLPAIEECKELSAQRAEISKAVKQVSPLTSKLKWLFSSKAKKALAEKSYEYLYGVSNSESLKRARECALGLRNAKRLTNADGWARFEADPVPFFNALEDICPSLMETDTTVYGLPEELAEAIQKVEIHTEGLKCTLRRYQEWGVKYALHQKRILLGDEMGLGKTVQAIAVMVSLRNTGGHHFVVVCPASVIANWCREIAKMSDLPVVRVHGAGRDEALMNWKLNGGVAVTTYETTEHFSLGEKYRFSALVVDEAHYIKNVEAQRSRNVRKLAGHAESIMFMTGTALENKVSEMVSLMEVLSPSVARSVRGMEFLASASEFREKIAPVYYRRRREDVLKELPELIENTDWCIMGKKEEQAYNEAVLSGNFASARRVSWNVSDLSCSSKAARLLEIVEDAAEEGRKVIVFSFFLDTVQKITSLLGERCMEPINGSVAPQRRQEIIDEFDKAPAGTVLAAQIQSGGTGLNIQSASVVVLCEPQFKPSIENQAISRAYRMGQTRNVLVHRLLCDETVDERISELLKNKQEIFDAFADESSVGSESLEIDERTFGSIMEEERKRIEQKTAEEKADNNNRGE